MKPLLLALSALGLALVAAGAAGQSRSKPEKPKPSASLSLLGKPMPRFDVSAWKNGEIELPKAANGKVTIVCFFSAESKDCESMIARHNEIVDRLGPKGLLLLSVATSESSAEAVAALAQEKGARFPIARDAKGKTAKTWGVESVPTYAVADGLTRLRAVEMTLDQSLELAENLLKEISPKGSKH